jgi:hypothetical protein
MRKCIISIFILTTFVFWLTSHLKAQDWNDVRYSDAQEHLEMMEIFVGTWELETGPDSTWVWELHPMEKGYVGKLLWKAGDKIYAEGRMIFGYAGPKGDKQITFYFLWPDGSTTRDVLKFLTEKKVVGRRYNLLHTNMYWSFEWEMQTPDKYTAVWVHRPGTSVEAWQREPRVIRQTWNRVK